MTTFIYKRIHRTCMITSRSLCLYVSKTETVSRPWYSEGSTNTDPDIRVSEPVAISTRVAPSFLRVGQLELFGRRARQHAHPDALKELEMIALHLIDREYRDEINQQWPLAEKLVALASAFRTRLTSLVGELLTLMMKTPVDYTIFFRELSSIPKDIESLQKVSIKNHQHRWKHSGPSGWNNDARWLERAIMSWW